MLVGEILGRYRVVEPVGSGGMASVYAGEHVVLNHRVAIKVLHEQYLEDPRMERRFLNEARAIAAIHHPGIVQLFDIGRAPDGRAYIVMELLKGHSLRQRISQGALPPAQALAFGRQMAEAIAAAHAHEIIHRDLKPDNAFIVADPEVPMGERIKVLDFGVSKRLSVTPTPELTGIGITLGTPEYMSPEQANGDTIDERADIYSLGVVLYEMATGILPFGSASTDELVANHMFVQSKPAVEVNGAISRELSDIIGQCLSKRREDRFSSMKQLGEALDEAAGDDADFDVTGSVDLPISEIGNLGDQRAFEAKLTAPHVSLFPTLEDSVVGSDTKQFFDLDVAYEDVDDDLDEYEDEYEPPVSRWPMLAAFVGAAAVVMLGAWLGLRSVDVHPSAEASVAAASQRRAPLEERAAPPPPAEKVENVEKVEKVAKAEQVAPAKKDPEKAELVPEPVPDAVESAPAVAKAEPREREVVEPAAKKPVAVAKKRVARSKPKSKSKKSVKKSEPKEDLFADVSTPTVF